MKIYLAGSFADANKEVAENKKIFLSAVASICEENGNTVFKPYEHKIPNAWNMSNKDWGNAVYGMDISELTICDIVVAVSNGRHESGNGSAWECGYACALNKPIILISRNPDKVESLMVVGGSTIHINKIDRLEEILKNAKSVDDLIPCREAENEVS
jgi:nucleoside 2-deoxyribosyltransferase